MLNNPNGAQNAETLNESNAQQQSIGEWNSNQQDNGVGQVVTSHVAPCDETDVSNHSGP